MVVNLEGAIEQFVDALFDLRSVLALEEPWMEVVLGHQAKFRVDRFVRAQQRAGDAGCVPARELFGIRDPFHDGVVADDVVRVPVGVVPKPCVLAYLGEKWVEVELPCSVCYLVWYPRFFTAGFAALVTA